MRAEALRRTFAALGLGIASVAFSPGIASATISGDCQSTFAGMSVGAGHDTPATAIRVDSTQTLNVEGTVGNDAGPGIAGSIRYTVEIAGVGINTSGAGVLDPDGRSWSGDAPVGNFAWASVGLALVRFQADTSLGGCSGAFYVCVTGKSPLATLLGDVSLLLGLTGVLLLVVTLRNLRAWTRRRVGCLGLLGEGLGALTLAVWLQQTCVGPLDLTSAVILPLATGAGAGLLLIAARGIVGRRTATDG